MMLTPNAPGYADNPLRHDMWRAGHAHAGVYLVLSLVMLRYVDEAAALALLEVARPSGSADCGDPDSRGVLPARGLSPSAKEPNGLIHLAYVGAAFLAGRGAVTRSRADSSGDGKWSGNARSRREQPSSRAANSSRPGRLQTLAGVTPPTHPENKGLTAPFCVSSSKQRWLQAKSCKQRAYSPYTHRRFPSSP